VNNKANELVSPETDSLSYLAIENMVYAMKIESHTFNKALNITVLSKL
jgi:hypothetical protein